MPGFLLVINGHFRLKANQQLVQNGRLELKPTICCIIRRYAIQINVQIVPKLLLCQNR